MSIFQKPDGSPAFDPRYPLGTPKPKEQPEPASKTEPAWRPVLGHSGYETDGKSVRPKPGTLSTV